MFDRLKNERSEKNHRGLKVLAITVMGFLLFVGFPVKVFVTTTAQADTTGVWINVTPANMDLSGSGNNLSCGNFGSQSVVVDPTRPSNLYAEANCQGIWKSTDYGATWTGPINTGTSGATVGDCAGGIAIAPGSGSNPPTIYESCIRGAGLGFSRSTDGGVNWTKFSVGVVAGREDYYIPLVDPYDGNHLIMAGHEMNSLVQSFNGGQTWSNLPINSSMNQSGGTASLFFINTGSAATTRTTILYLAQQEGGTIGTWRTTNGGSSWTRVESNEHPHGTSQIYQPDNNGVVYMAGVYSPLGWGVLRSTDYGATWVHVGSSGNQAIVYGTPNKVYSDYSWACGGCNVDPTFQSASQPGITGWSGMTTPAGMNIGPAMVATTYNGSNYVLIGASWLSGLWRFVEAPGSGTPPPPPGPTPPPPPPDTTAPTVSVSAPTTGSTVSGSSISITANASDNIGVVGVQFKLDGNNLGSEDTTSPYSFTWDTTGATNASHNLSATARDTSNNTTTSSSVSVTVNNVVTPPPPPPPSGTPGYIYDDALRNNWTNSSWATVTLGDTGKIHTGTNAIGVTYGAFSGLYFTTTSFNTTGNTNLDFYINSSTNAPVLAAMLRDTTNKLGPTIFLSTYCNIVANAWTHCVIPLTALMNGLTSTILGVDIQEQSGNNLAKMYFDDISIIGGGATAMLGDINLDHIVNSIDFSLLNSHWFGVDTASDLNHDGIVNAIDFSLLNQNWLKTW